MRGPATKGKVHGKPNLGLPPLNALRAFEAAARHESFTRAASELNVTHGAVSRQIKGLEDYLGVALFRRSARAVELTDDGRRYLIPLRQAFEQVRRATESLTSGRHATTLTVNVLPTFGMRWLIPRLIDFNSINPSIEVHIVTSIEAVDLKQEETDIAIRVGPPAGTPLSGDQCPIDTIMTRDWSDVCAVPLLPDELVVVCSPALIEAGPLLTSPTDLEHHILLHTATRERAWSYWLNAQDVAHCEPRGDLYFGHFFLTVQAAIEGKGVAVVPRILAASELAAGSLILPFEATPVISGTYYLLFRDSQSQTPKIRKFHDWIRDVVAGNK